MAQEKEILEMSFDPLTIEHLGIKMYSKLPNAIAELIANAYDADASNVAIKLYDNEEKKIVVSDNGTGMSFDEINECFLRIGRNRRKDGAKKSESGNRKVTGKKGLGKLALFGIGNTITISTTRKGYGERIKFTLDWDELISVQNDNYKPNFTITKVAEDIQGTDIILTNLKRTTAFDKEGLGISLSKLFTLLSDEFIVTISRNDDELLIIDPKLRYENLIKQFEWSYQELIKNFDIDYGYKENIKGEIIATEKPLKPAMRGITLYANGRLVNAPEFFGVSESSHGFSYLTGWLETDFIDEWDNDVISTHRQSLNWGVPSTEALREFLKKFMSHIERVWRTKRKEERKKELNKKTEINIDDWFEKVPKEILDKLEVIVTTIDEKSELNTEELGRTVANLHTLIPEYTYYHWRYLHKEIQDASKEDYEKKDYYRAFIEGAKRFINLTREKSTSNQTSDSTLMGDVFGAEKILSVTKKYKKKDGTEFSESTKRNIEEGQKFLSMGIVQGGRNPVSHEEIRNLHDSDLFSEKDCLDGLSLLSHLMKRLENSEKNE